MTHVKLAVIALVARIGAAGFGFASLMNTGDGYIQTAHVIKAKAPLRATILALALPIAE